MDDKNPSPPKLDADDPSAVDTALVAVLLGQCRGCLAASPWLDDCGYCSTYCKNTDRGGGSW